MSGPTPGMSTPATRTTCLPAETTSPLGSGWIGVPGFCGVPHTPRGKKSAEYREPVAPPHGGLRRCHRLAVLRRLLPPGRVGDAAEPGRPDPVSYTHLTLPTNREV